MELQDALAKRRSIRDYLPEKLKPEDLETLVTASRYAPSACNFQGLRLIVIDDENTKRKIIDRGAAWFLKSAPTWILVLYDNRTRNTHYHDYELSAALAVQNLMLKAVEIGISTGPICHLPPKRELRKILGIPRCYDPIIMLAVGYSNAPSPPRKEIKYDKIVAHNRFDFEVPKSEVPFMHRSLRRIYYVLPVFLRKRLRGFVEKKVEIKFPADEKK